jgi:AcrR family transcriptional regulator
MPTLDSRQAPGHRVGVPAPADQHLLDLALEAFAERGYDGTSVRDVCRRAGVSHNLVHERYGSKEAFWYASVDHGFRSLAEDLAQAAAGAGPDDFAQLRAILLRYVETTAEQPSLIRLINTEAAHPGPRLDHIYQRYIEPAHALADAFLRRLERAGRIRRVPAATLHFLIGHGAGGIVSLPGLAGKWQGRRSEPPLLDQARSAVELILDAMSLEEPVTAPVRRRA